MSNKAAVLPEKQAHPFKIDDVPIPEPGARQITLRTRAVAINPVDMAVQAMGILFENYPKILGSDVAGEVTAIGSEVTRFKVGDRVFGVYDEGKDLTKTAGGTFQLYCTTDDAVFAKLPDNVDFKDGSVLPLGMTTAAEALFEEYNLGLPFPQDQPKQAGKVLLIWGGASSVGSCGIQAAKAAGLEVATTASGKNAEYCKSIGADYVFDYKKDSVVDDVVKALKGKEFAGVFSAVMGEDVLVKSAEIAMQLGGKQMVATVLPPMMKVEKPLPGGVAIGYNWAMAIKDTPVGPAIWQQWITDALAKGTLKCKPDAHVVGSGLEKIQEAVDLMKGGASAQKFVVELP